MSNFERATLGMIASVAASAHMDANPDNGVQLAFAFLLLLFGSALTLTAMYRGVRYD